MTNSKLYFKTIILFIVFLFIFIFRNNIFYLFGLINTSVKKENGKNLFHVILDISDKDGNKLITNEFDVIPVNELT